MGGLSVALIVINQAKPPPADPLAADSQAKVSAAERMSYLLTQQFAVPLAFRARGQSHPKTRSLFTSEGSASKHS